jgi:hypothetical protein
MNNGTNLIKPLARMTDSGSGYDEWYYYCWESFKNCTEGEPYNIIAIGVGTSYRLYRSVNALRYKVHEDNPYLVDLMDSENETPIMTIDITCCIFTKYVGYEIRFVDISCPKHHEIHISLD